MSSSDSFSSPQSDQSPPEKKQRLESDGSNDGKGDVFHHDEETLMRMIDDHGPVDEDYSDDEREITDEEIEQYKAALRASDGFDVPLFPGICCCGLITPVVPLDDYDHEQFRPLCVAAMKHYNDEKGTNYEFLKLEKANAQAARGIQYYFTFVGRIPKVNTTHTFEAVVLRGIPNMAGEPCTEVYFCREKASPDV